NEMKELADLNFDMDLTGFDKREVSQILHMEEANAFDLEEEAKKIKPEDINNDTVNAYIEELKNFVIK
ncbi:MAG: hypothetical protein AABY22_16090, partial [Nanoarchaeota archaeon]